MDRSSFEREGAWRFERRLGAAQVEALRALADERMEARPGARLRGEPQLNALLAREGPVGAVAAILTSSEAWPVRAVMFDKTVNANWVVGWHQDRTIAVRKRLEVNGFGPWSNKDGVLHVAPPFDVLARMVTLRVHMDRVDETNAPLRVLLGSHAWGRVATDRVSILAAAGRQMACIAEVGDIWAYRTPILHASDRALTPGRRRVLQVDYADFDLPGGLRWQGLAG